MKRFKKNNKGFSLVELIVVIAIMAILGVAVALAVTKFIPQSQRSTDISNANMIAEACEVAINDFATAPGGKLKSVTNASTEYSESDIFASSGVDLAKLVDTGLLKSNPDIQGSATGLTVNTTKKFSVTYNKTNGKTTCIIGTKGGTNVDLCDATTAQNYKNDSL